MAAWSTLDFWGRGRCCESRGLGSTATGDNVGDNRSTLSLERLSQSFQKRLGTIARHSAALVLHKNFLHTFAKEGKWNVGNEQRRARKARGAVENKSN